MFNSELQKMYQAWMQGNNTYVRDWYQFAEWAARWNSESVEKTLNQLDQCHWFRKGE